MNRIPRLGRRAFLQGSAATLGVGGLLSKAHPTAFPASLDDPVQIAMGPAQGVWILREPGAGFQEQLASRELSRGLRNLGLRRTAIEAVAREGQPATGDWVFSLHVDRPAFAHPEAYEISNEPAGKNEARVRLTGATPQALLYAVFGFLEEQGGFFGLDGEVYPLDSPQRLKLPRPATPVRAQPRFDVRGTLPWPDFLNCVTVYNREDFRAYLESLLRMRFNTLGIHVYSGAKQWTESFLSFEYAGAGHLAFTDTSATNRWGYIPERTSRFGMGAADYFDGEVFGSEATTLARNCWEAEEMAQRLWAEAFQYAEKLGMRTGVGFEPYSLPDEIVRAVPPEALFPKKDPEQPGPAVDPESRAARDILEARLGALLEAYPTVDYVWLWEDEGSNWASQKADVPLSLAPFNQAHDFLRRHAPKKRLVISGWGGVVRHFAHFHRHLPGDIVFTSLNDNLGWDPVSEEYAKLEGRERWPIPWLEDDPGMWLPQFHVNRFVRDMDRARNFGCQGLIGIHWRHRIMEANASFQARYSWDAKLEPRRYYQAFASAHASGPRAAKLAEVLNDTDEKRLILDSWSGEIKDGHYQIHEYSGDYDEAFQFWNDYEPPERVKKSQAEVARQLRALADSASGPAERERLNYLTRHVEFLVPYSESWSLARRLHQVLQQAMELKTQKKLDDAVGLVRSAGVPLWLKLAPLVREALLDFQDAVSTRNDLGTLASMHNKYERLALYRLRASLKEFLGDLPPETERMFDEVRQPGAKAAPRVFVPTRPTFLRPEEQVRIWAVAPGPAKVLGMILLTRSREETGWQRVPMTLVGRRTYVGQIAAHADEGPFVDYYVEASLEKNGGTWRMTDPAGPPDRYYSITVV